MAVMYASNVFSTKALGDRFRQEVMDWLTGVENDVGRFRVTITVDDLDGGERMKKLSAAQKLQALAKEMSVSDKNSWVDGDYAFYFLTAGYVWQGRRIHITASEGLFLFHWLILKDETYFKTKWFLLRNMRRRLGSGFLKEVENGDGV